MCHAVYGSTLDTVSPLLHQSVRELARTLKEKTQCIWVMPLFYEFLELGLHTGMRYRQTQGMVGHMESSDHGGG